MSVRAMIRRWAVLTVPVVLIAACSAPTRAPELKPTAALAPWSSCPGADGLECSILTVPFDYERSDGNTFTLPVIRVPSRATNPKLMLTNPGGPGISGVNDLRSGREYFEKFADEYTVVSFDPRGVGGSAPAIRCLDDQQRQAIFNQPSVPTSGDEIAHAQELAAGIGDACRRQFEDALGHLGTANVVRDMDELRAAMGFERTSYLGYSYGTFLGALYADMFPQRTDRMVLDSVMDPKLNYPDVRRGQAQGMQRSVTAFVEDCLRRTDCPLTAPNTHALQQISDVIATLDRQPFTGADGRTLSGARMLALVESSQYFPESGWPSLRETLRHAVAGDWPAVVDAAYSPDLMVNPADSEYLSVVCIDFPTDRDPQEPVRLAPQWAAQSPISGGNRAWSLEPCESWPAAPVRQPGPVNPRGAGPVLILNTTGDPATPLAWAQSLHDQIENSTLVIAPAEGHIASSQNVCAEDTLTAFLKAGTLPRERIFTCPPNR